jgi:putative membrane protein
MMHGNGWDEMGSWGWAGMTLMMLFWFGLVALIVWALVSPRGRRGTSLIDPTVRRDPALDTLRERFARGEITAEEYAQSRQVLEGR